jgi:nicotinamidase-related amidase
MKTTILKLSSAIFCLSLVTTKAAMAQKSDLDAKNSVLLITSAQVDLLSENGKAWGFTKASEEKNKVRKHLKQLIKKARQLNMPIIHSPVGFDYEKMKGFQPLNGIQGVIVEHQLLDMNTSGCDFIPEARPHSKDIVLPYRQGFSSFWAESIQGYLKKRGVKTIYLAGMLAEGCITSHTRDASENGYKTVVITDAIGATSLDLLEASKQTLGLHAKALINTDAFLNLQ